MNDDVFGLHAVKALLEQSPERIVSLWVSQEKQDNKINEIIKISEKLGISTNKISIKALAKRYPQANHQGVVAVCKQKSMLSEHDIPELLAKVEGRALVLVLDGVTDPHNLGACLRTADASGVNFVIIPKDKAVGLTATVAKVACGAVETVPVVSATNLARALEYLKEAGVWIYGAAGEASSSIYQTEFTGATAIVLGREGEGMRRLTRETCDYLFSIPMMGTVESLNVSVAAGISLYEALRQRQ